jgi:hypothetical protein
MVDAPQRLEEYQAIRSTSFPYGKDYSLGCIKWHTKNPYLDVNTSDSSQEMAWNILS